MKPRNWADWAGAILGLAIVYVLVRPQSKGAALVTAFGDAMTSLTTHATDLANN